jgi:membrane protein YqaA with SNARE-associated domain
VNKELLLVVLSAQRPDLFAWYAAIAALGSLIGCTVLYVVSRKAGKLLQGRIKRTHSEFVHKQVHKHGSAALAVGSVLPPPFPFTSLVLAAGAVGYSLPKFIGTIGVARFVRFAVVAGLGAHWSDSILSVWESTAAQVTALAILLGPLALLAFPVYRWLNRFGSSPNPAQS